VAQRNDRPAGAIRRTEFGLQVRLPQVIIFSHLQNTGSHCDAGVTQLNGVGRKLGFRLLENRLAHKTGKRANHTPFLPKVRELTFLRNHREAIAAMDFFTVPTLTFGVLHCFFVVAHDRRKILHCNVTRNRHALWVGQQLREAWAYKQPHRFLLFDHDAKFGADVISVVKNIGSQPTRTAFRSPWQNGVAER